MDDFSFGFLHLSYVILLLYFFVSAPVNSNNKIFYGNLFFLDNPVFNIALRQGRPGRPATGMGGAMDLAVGCRSLIVMMRHTTKDGAPRIVKQCSFPLTARRCVDKIFTDLAVIDVTEQGLVLKEIAPGWTAEEVQKLTEAPLIVAQDLKEIEL